MENNLPIRLANATHGKDLDAKIQGLIYLRRELLQENMVYHYETIKWLRNEIDNLLQQQAHERFTK